MFNLFVGLIVDVVGTELRVLLSLELREGILFPLLIPQDWGSFRLVLPF
jgi:hypothetical protein